MLKRRLSWILLVAGIAMAVYWITLAMIPSTLMHVAMGRIEQNGPINSMGHAPLSTAERRVIVRPSPDLAYSTCLFDLSDGPLEIVVEPIGSPYWSLSVFDANTNVAFVRNDREADGEGLRVALVREGQAVGDIEQVSVPTDRGLALLRILVPERDAFEAIDADRRNAWCASLN